MPRLYSNLDSCVDDLMTFAGERVVIGTPLGIGKPNALLNTLYQRIKADPSRRLRILTALSLQTPQTSSALEEAFLRPFIDRVLATTPISTTSPTYASKSYPPILKCRSSS
mgnify:CR=1 FL=1